MHKKSQKTTNHIFKRVLKNKSGLGTPVANLIIIMAAVMLSTVVVLFATNITSSQVQKEKVFIASSHIWYIDDTKSIAAIGITNTGPTDVVLSKITINGLQSEWKGAANYVAYSKIDGPLPGDLAFVAQINDSANTTIAIAGQSYDFTPATEGLTIKAGNSIAFYIVIPNTISIFNLSTPVDIVITTTQGVYCTQALVQSSS